VGKYVGYTARIVKEYFEKAKGNVLFIDEAYSLADKDNQGDFGNEAIDTIVQEMENNREDLVVIFAGYKKEMKEFIRRNSGLSSRVSFYIDFPDYSDDELYAIFEKMANENHYKLKENVHDAFIDHINSIVTSNGNGRLVRNIFERARIRQSSRIKALPIKQLTKELFVLSAQDIGGDDE
jgi:SpoVK/Ycf46/Vps4 family AAA+-type ATPase